MARAFIQLVGWIVFLALTLISAFLIAEMLPYEGNGQAIPGAGLGFFLMWCPSLFVFSAIATLFTRFLMRWAGLTHKKKKVPPSL